MQPIDKTIASVISWFNQEPEQKRVAAARKRHAIAEERRFHEFVSLVADELVENGVSREDPRFRAILTSVVIAKLQRVAATEDPIKNSLMEDIF